MYVKYPVESLGHTERLKKKKSLFFHIFLSWLFFISLSGHTFISLAGWEAPEGQVFVGLIIASPIASITTP